MYSWIFRHRLRLRVIYGLHFPTDPEEADLPRLPAHDPPPALPAAGESTASEPVEAGAKGSGTIVRRGRYVVLSPRARPAL